MTKTKQNVLVLDVGGNNVKVIDSRHDAPVKIPSGPAMSASLMVADVRKATEGWDFTAVSIGYPGIVFRGKPVTEPHNLAPGWVGFDFEAAFGCPVRIVNDAAMQALGSYEGGRMLFLGFGTGLGAAMILEGVLAPMELAHLPYRKGRTFEDYVGQRGLDLDLKALNSAEPQSQEETGFPQGVKLGSNANAFRGGFRLWDDEVWKETPEAPAPAKAKPASRKAR